MLGIFVENIVRARVKLLRLELELNKTSKQMF